MTDENDKEEDLVEAIEKGGRRLTNFVNTALTIASLSAAVYLFVEGDLQRLVDLLLVRLPESLRQILNEMFLGLLVGVRANLEVIFGGVYFKHVLFSAAALVLGLLLRFGLFWFMRLSPWPRGIATALSIFFSVVLVMLVWNLVYYAGAANSIDWHFEASSSFDDNTGFTLKSHFSSDKGLSWATGVVVVATIVAFFSLFVAFDTSPKENLNPSILLVGLLAGLMGLAACWQYIDAKLAPKPAFVAAAQCERTTAAQLSTRQDLILGAIQKVTSDLPTATGEASRNQQSGDHLTCLEFQLGSTARFRLAYLLAHHNSDQSQCDIYAIDGGWDSGAINVQSAKLLKTFYGPDCASVKKGLNKSAIEYFDETAIDTFLHTNEGLPIVTDNQPSG